MNDEFIPLSVPNLKGNELIYVTKAVDSEWVSTAGPYISEFEQALAKYVKVSAAVACQSGTAGLHLALLAVGVQPGEEVIVPTLTFIAAVNPIRYVGAEPVFMDCDDSLTMDPDKLEDFCKNSCKLVNGLLTNKSTGKTIKALIIVHVFGNLADMSRVMKIAGRYNLKVVEDATEALGSYYTNGIYAGQFAGTIGEVGVYSFNGNKIITTGGGGMIVSSDKGLTERCRFLSTQAKKDTVYFVHDEVGYNYRMTNLQAALGLAQLEQLEGFIKRKQANYTLYMEHGIKLLPFRPEIRSNYWFYSYLTDNRDELIKYLEANKVQSRPIWQLIHTLRPYRENQAYQIEKASWYYDRVVNIPCSTNLQPHELERVCCLIKRFEEGYICS